MEMKCEELEKRFPSCSVIDICFEEKLQCEALCRGSAMLTLRAGRVSSFRSRSDSVRSLRDFHRDVAAAGMRARDPLQTKWWDGHSVRCQASSPLGVWALPTCRTRP